MLQVPLIATPSQTVTVTVDSQQSRINVYQKFYGLFFDLLKNNVLVIGGVLCENNNRLIRSQYLGYNGDFVFTDTQGSDDPNWAGLGSRWQLVYGTPAELAAMGLVA